MKSLLRAATNSHLASYTDPIGLGASEVLSEQSLRAVIKAGAYIDAADGADTEILGFVDFTGTSGTSDGDDSVPVENSGLVSYEAPYHDGTTAGAALTQSTLDKMVGTTVAIKRVGDIQYADSSNTTAAQQVLIVTGGKAGAAGEAIVNVKANPKLVAQVEAVDAI